MVKISTSALQVFTGEECRTWQPGQLMYYIVSVIVMYFMPSALALSVLVVVLVKIVSCREPGVHGRGRKIQVEY